MNLRIFMLAATVGVLAMSQSGVANAACTPTQNFGKQVVTGRGCGPSMEEKAAAGAKKKIDDAVRKKQAEDARSRKNSCKSIPGADCSRVR